MADILRNLQHQKVAIYIRVSTRYQVDKDSLQVQRRELTAYSEMVLGIQDYVIFEDPGYSAKNTDRPDYQRMMDRLRTGEFTHLLVWKIDRISRNLLDFAAMYQELKDLGIAFVSKNEQFDTSNAVGEAMLKIILVFAELERQMTSERVTAVMLSRANNGQWNGGRVPYGYNYDKETKTFSIHPDEGKIVCKIYDLYEEYQSTLYIARYFNDLGLRSRAGKEWSATQVHKILTNIFYIGDYRYNVHRDGKGHLERDKTEWMEIRDHHIPIISRDKFERVQFILQRNKRGGAHRGESHMRQNIHIFSGMMKCGVCGSNMSATLDRRRADGWRPSIYACQKRRNDSGNCQNKYISDITLGPFVFNFIANLIRAKEGISESVDLLSLEKKLLRGPAFKGVSGIDQESLEKTKSFLLQGKSGVEYVPPSIEDDNFISEKDVLEDRRRRLESALSRLKALYLYGDKETPESEYIVEREKIATELAEVEAKLSKLQSEESHPINNDEFIKKASYFIMAEKLLTDRYVDYEKYIRKIDPSVPRSFLLNIVVSIEATNGKVTEIAFKNGVSYRFSYT